MEEKYVLAIRLVVDNEDTIVYYDETKDNRMLNFPNLDSLYTKEEAEGAKQVIIKDVNNVIELYRDVRNPRIKYLSPGMQLPALIFLSALDRLHDMDIITDEDGLPISEVFDIIQLNDYWISIELLNEGMICDALKHLDSLFEMEYTTVWQ